MKVLQELTKSDLEWKIPSKSEIGEFHKVSFSKIMGWECSCIAYSMSKNPKNCKHINLIKMKYGNKL